MTDLKAEKKAVLQEIYDAFADVTREGGMSWTETMERDAGYEEWSKENFIPVEPRGRGSMRPFHDQDKTWRDLINDPEWKTDPAYGGFSFLDPIGGRYYLPVALVRSLRQPKSFWIGIVLQSYEHSEHLADHRERLRELFLQKWSALNARQISCVRSFLAYKLAIAEVILESFLSEIDGVLEMSDKDLSIQRQAMLFPWEPAYISWQNLPDRKPSTIETHRL